MKKVINSRSILFCIGIVIGMLVVGLTKPSYIVERPIYTYLKVADWSKESNPKKIAYYEHLYNNK